MLKKFRKITADLQIVRKERTILEWFHVSIFLKGTYAFFETLVGLLTFIVPPSAIVSLVNILTRDELIEDPNDAIATYLLHTAQQLSIGTEAFIALYLTVNGALKIILVLGLWKNKAWAYPASLIIFSAFAVYELYLCFIDRSLPVAILLLLDAITVWFVWKEYLVQKRHHALA